MRNSPPIQPGEPVEKLPSFSEFCLKTRADTPPRTPSRRNGSADSSPHGQPQFDDVTWQGRKRQREERNDTLGDIYAHSGRSAHATDHSSADPRRMSSAIDPAIHYQNAHREAIEAPSYAFHRRQSSSYPPPPAHLATSVHDRHRSSPIPQVHPSYRQPSVHQSISGPSAYHPATVQGQPVYEHRHSYYAEAPPVPYGYGYDRPQDAYYPRTQYSGAASQPSYDNTYSDNIRFQPHVGSMDPQAFNRKRRGNLPKEATNMMKQWFAENRDSPYPTEDQKLEICRRTGLNLSQVSNWFINARRRAPGKEARDREASAALNSAHHGSEE
ncbi:hypothetical protein CC86DRAFT_337248 [Ophiobolus disseminans]|uniref:Homeobox domain-containing protein n=1 Tax=Ophiobolus disseminans TaxID=1469910 RepID=A0A6A6ZC03_9PLEO|nr:hypothetical protein CC86DRAFT_337248 [Ophiobolus disseminans]